MLTNLSLQEKIAELGWLLGADVPCDLHMYEVPSNLKVVPTRLEYHTTAPLDLLNAELDSGTQRNSTNTNDSRNAVPSVV